MQTSKENQHSTNLDLGDQDGLHSKDGLNKLWMTLVHDLNREQDNNKIRLSMQEMHIKTIFCKIG